MTIHSIYAVRGRSFKKNDQDLNYKIVAISPEAARVEARRLTWGLPYYVERPIFIKKLVEGLK